MDSPTLPLRRVHVKRIGQDLVVTFVKRLMHARRLLRLRDIHLRALVLLVQTLESIALLSVIVPPKSGLPVK